MPRQGFPSAIFLSLALLALAGCASSTVFTKLPDLTPPPAANGTLTPAEQKAAIDALAAKKAAAETAAADAIAKSR